MGLTIYVAERLQLLAYIIVNSFTGKQILVCLVERTRKGKQVSLALKPTDVSEAHSKIPFILNSRARLLRTLTRRQLPVVQVGFTCIKHVQDQTVIGVSIDPTATAPDFMWKQLHGKVAKSLLCENGCAPSVSGGQWRGEMA